MFLNRVANMARERVKLSKDRISTATLEGICAGSGPPPSFSGALLRLTGEEIRVIAEVKRSSPSRGPIRPDLVLEDLVGAYERGGASAVSVLTEPAFFGGDLQDIARARSVTGLPILRKDFIIDPYQLLESRAAGASAVLLISALLEKAELASMLEKSRELGLDALVEVHDKEDLAAALMAGADAVGINNRDLNTLKVDLETTRRLAPLVPLEKILVSESGYSSREQAREALASGVDAILVGEALVRDDDPEKAVAGLRSDGHAHA